jgi:hypothetical protein
VKKHLIFLSLILILVSPLVYSIGSEPIHHDNFKVLQTGEGKLITETKKIESQISEKVLKNNLINKILENPQDSGIILIEYFNDLFQDVISESSIYDLIGFSIGMVAYGIFVYHFYKFLSKRDIFSFNLEKKIAQRTFKSSGKKKSVAPRTVAFITTKLFIFPFVIFLWFLGYSSFMFLLVQNMPTETIFLVSSGLIIAIRISAYYNEDLSKDMAKLIPFTLLGIFLINPQFYSFSDSLSRLLEIPYFIIQVASFIILAMIVEIIFSTLYLIKIRFFTKESDDTSKSGVDTI